MDITILGEFIKFTLTLDTLLKDSIFRQKNDSKILYFNIHDVSIALIRKEKYTRVRFEGPNFRIISDEEYLLHLPHELPFTIHKINESSKYQCPEYQAAHELFQHLKKSVGFDNYHVEITDSRIRVHVASITNKVYDGPMFERNEYGYQYAGVYVDGLRQGLWLWENTIGMYVDDKKDGEHFSFEVDGSRIVKYGKYDMGIPIGKHIKITCLGKTITNYDDQGRKHGYSWELSESHGDEYDYYLDQKEYVDGVKLKEINCGINNDRIYGFRFEGLYDKNGAQGDHVTQDLDGNMIHIIQYKDGKKNGVEKWWYKNERKISSLSTWKEDQLDGKYKMWNKDGELEYHGIYKDYKLICVKHRFPQAQIYPYTNVTGYQVKLWGKLWDVEYEPHIYHHYVFLEPPKYPGKPITKDDVPSDFSYAYQDSDIKYTQQDEELLKKWRVTYDGIDSEYEGDNRSNWKFVTRDSVENKHDGRRRVNVSDEYKWDNRVKDYYTSDNEKLGLPMLESIQKTDVYKKEFDSKFKLYGCQGDYTYYRHKELDIEIGIPDVKDYIKHQRYYFLSLYCGKHMSSTLLTLEERDGMRARICKPTTSESLEWID